MHILLRIHPSAASFSMLYLVISTLFVLAASATEYKTCAEVKAEFKAAECCATSMTKLTSVAKPGPAPLGATCTGEIPSAPWHSAYVPDISRRKLNSPWGAGTTGTGPSELFIPTVTTTSAFTQATTTCAEVKQGYEAHCCGMEDSEEFDPVQVARENCFVEAGSHIAHAEAFNGAKIQALLSASECVALHPGFDWQRDPRHPKNEFCFVGAMDGLQAKPVLGDGTMQTLSTGKTYMRTFINTEIRGKNDYFSALWAVSTNPNLGGFDQPGTPGPDDILIMHGAMEMFADLDRDTLEVVNGGQSIKKVWTARGFGHNGVIPPTATSAETFTIVTKYSDLHINVKYNSETPNEPTCDPAIDPDEDLRFCGLYGHCGNGLGMKHQFNYNVNGAPAYGSTTYNGPEDDFVLIAQEGGSCGSFGPCGTVQILDVARGDMYALPQLSVGVIEMAFLISSGHDDFIAIGIEDYGVGSYYDELCGSGWTVWIGKKDRTASTFLDRNGLGVNQGRLYRFVASNGETDMATFTGWPQSGTYTQSPKANGFTADFVNTFPEGYFEPIDTIFDGRYGSYPAGCAGETNRTGCTYQWTRESTSCAKTITGKTPIRMSGVGKQEWGSTNPDKPNQWVIAETGIGYSKPNVAPYAEGETIGAYNDMSMGSRSSSMMFLEADFVEAFASMSGSVTNRAGETMPEKIDARVFHVMNTDVQMGPDRAEGGVGLSYVDSAFWAKGNRVYFAEDSNAPGGYNIAGAYNPATRSSITLAGAIGNDNRKMNSVANFPAGSFHRGSDQELTGWFDASAVLTVSFPYTPQSFYDALTGTDMILNNQMKGYGHGCMDYGFYYSAQMMYVHVPPYADISDPKGADQINVSPGQGRRQLKKWAGNSKSRKLSAAKDVCFETGTWENFKVEFDDTGCQMH